MSKILCVGAAVVDFVFHLETLPSRPEKYGTEEAHVVGGGCAANAAVAVARLGGTAVLGARLGDDSIGDLIVEDLAREGVDVSNVTRTKGAKSSYSSVLIDAAGERQIVNFRGAGLVLATDWFDGLEDVSAVLTDTRRVDAALAALQLASARGIPGVLDGEAPIDPALMSAASHVALSMQGLRDLYPDTDVEAALLDIAVKHDCWVCVTDGADGVWYTDGGQTRHMAAFPITPIDTLGAGDVWHGVFALLLAEGQSAEEAIRHANGAAALKCLKKGGRAGAPSRAALTEYLKETT
ncbi:putative sugar kinase YdjH [Shimia sp. SK013]|uniref:PfkB family carbohydrate kinase n=1 Tax=Shimia sp. SK013 TaxID=1389006 RepID=UPI0006B45F44|nr:PfkB family carbohydrate kinase [Shimia sp. SK013]KPA20698.1 putative sugar kinase YdjH [Shimia sp. SK013]